MHHCILKRRIGKIDLADLALGKRIQNILTDFHGIRIDRLLNHVRIIRLDLIRPLQGVPSLLTNRINAQILARQLSLCDQLDHIGIVPAGKPSVRGNHNNGFSSRLCVISSGSQKSVIEIFGFCQNGLNRTVHAAEIIVGFFCILLCSLQLNSRNKLHCFGNLLGTLDTSPAPFYVSH